LWLKVFVDLLVEAYYKTQGIHYDR
jgi:hypothetical protein